MVQTATAPLANGPSQPATQTIVRNLRQIGYDVPVDDAVIDDFSDHLAATAVKEGTPFGVPMEYDAYHFEHQIPGGMLTNLQSQLADVGLSDRFHDVIAECVLIRKELGWPIMVTPFAQFVVTQAVYNFMSSERYSVIPDVVKQYALGHFGKLLAPVEADVMDRIVENGSQSIPLEPKPLAPAVPELQKTYPDASDEERLLRFMFSPGDQVEKMLAAPPIQTNYTTDDQPVHSLLHDIASLQSVSRVSINSPSLTLEVKAGG